MKVRLILAFLAALFIAGNVMSQTVLPRKYKGLDIVLRGEVGTDTNRSIPIIPIEALVGDEDGLVHILFEAPLGTVQVLVNGQVQEVCNVTTVNQETSFSIEGWTPGIYKLEIKTPDGGYVYGEFIIPEK